MQQRILQQTKWAHLPALELESQRLRVVPALGGKLVSLVDKAADYEWLIGPSAGVAGPIPYGGSFLQYSMFGWDEMFPTIDACAYPVEGAYYTAALPDHGDAWMLEWQVEPSPPGELRLAVDGQALPYRLERSLTFTTADSLLMQYRLTNRGSEPFHFLWAAHPLFYCQGEAELVLPSTVTELVAVASLPTGSVVGARHNWPCAENSDGHTLALNRISDSTRRVARKFYLPPELPISWATLVQRQTGNWLRMSWSSARLPYCGIWIDEGYYTPVTTVAFEPSTAYYDNLAQAWQQGRAPRIDPGMQYSWTVMVTVGSHLRRSVEWEVVS
jgi:galactose mutarotase-like enzyme